MKRKIKDNDAEFTLTRRSNKLRIKSDTESESEPEEIEEESGYEKDKDIYIEISQENDSGESMNVSSDIENEDICFICKEDGRLLCCDNCYRTFHLTCLGIKNTPRENNWECCYCKDNSKDICLVCDKPIDRKSEIKLTCSLCYRLQHLGCVKGIPLRYIIDCPINQGYSLNAEGLNLLHQYQRNDTPEHREQLEKFLEGHYLTNNQKELFYVCTNCISYFRCGKILDSATIDDKDTQLFLMKFQYASFLHCYWISYDEAEKIGGRKLKNFIDRQNEGTEEEEPEKESTNEDLNNGGNPNKEANNGAQAANQNNDELSEQLEEYVKIERILECKRPMKFQSKSFKDIYQSIFNKYDTVYEQQIQYGQKNNYKFYVKWAGLGYDKCNWEDEFVVLKYKDQLANFLQIKIYEELMGNPAKLREEKEKRRKLHLNQINTKIDPNQPLYIAGGSLHKFQIYGFKWLCDSFVKNNNVILADEMGLGKTIQTLSFLYYLYHEKQIDGPFLVVGPSTTLYNWLRETQIWTQKFNVIVYIGNPDSREIIRQREFYYRQPPARSKKSKKKPAPQVKFNILITSYDIAIMDTAYLKKISWSVLVVDEAHRLKNNQSKFFQMSSMLKARHKVLLTGTPLQNNILELFNLIEFISPQKAKTLKNYETLKLFLEPSGQLLSTTKEGSSSNKQQQEVVNISEEDKRQALSDLTRLLGPHLLRRKKADVDIQLPEMEEIIIKLSLSDTQKYYYKNILIKNYENLKILESNQKNVSKMSLLNILMSLRLVCNHHYLFLYKKKYTVPPSSEFKEKFIESSNKLKFLERVIPKLIQKEEKMLVFSQFTMMLDILSSFCEYKGYNYERLDGQTNIVERQKIIDSFNNKDSKSYIFLLSTRAGGLGINLTSASTIFFTDSDFNPYRDVQAISRAHRMGQHNKVKVYRLVSKFSAEEKIIEVATKKLLLESIIINPINKFSKGDFDQIFKNGSLEMFNKNFEEKDQEITDEQIDALLSRDNLQPINSNIENVKFVKNDINDYYLSGFKFTSLNFEQVNNRKDEDNGKENQYKLAKYWDTLLEKTVEELKKKEDDEMGKGKRQKKLQYQTFLVDEVESDNQSEYTPQNNQDKTQSSNSSDSRIVEEKDVLKPKREKPEKTAEELAKIQEALKAAELKREKQKKAEDKIVKYFEEEVYSKSLLKNSENLQDAKSLVINGFSEHYRLLFVQFICQFGLDFQSTDSFWGTFLKKICDPTKGFGQRPSYDDFKRYLKEFYSYLLFQEDLSKIQKELIFCGQDESKILDRVIRLQLLKKKIIPYQKKPEKFRIQHKDYHFNQLLVDLGDDKKIKACDFRWTNFDDYCLIQSIVTYGYGNWKIILGDKKLWQFSDDDFFKNNECWLLIFRKFDGNPNREFTSLNQKIAQEWTQKKIEDRCKQLTDWLIDIEFCK